MDGTGQILLLLFLLLVVPDQVFPGPECPIPDRPANAFDVAYNRSVGGVAGFVCKPGYVSIGAYASVCLEDLTWSSDPPICDFDECAANVTLCGGNVTCVNILGSFDCVCELGYIFNDDSCVDLDECEANSVNPCGSDATCINTVGSFTCNCNLGYAWTGTTCTECLHTGDPHLSSFGQCKPLLLDGLVSGFCTNCDDFTNVTYQWKLGKRFNTSSNLERDCMLLEPTYSERTGSTATFSCNSSDCNNILNGGTDDKLTLVLTVAVQNDNDGYAVVKSSTSTDVFVRQLPILDADLQCTLSPGAGEHAFPTEFQFNCTSLHKRYNLFDDGKSDFYADNSVKLRKQIIIETEGNDTIEFIKPVSETFALPPGDPVTVKLAVYNCDNLILSQVMQRKVQSDFYTRLDNGDFSLVYNSSDALRDTGNLQFAKMRKIVVSKLMESNISTIEDPETAIELLNMITERGDWMDDNDISVLLKSTSTTLDHFIEETNETVIESANMTILMDLLMDTLDNVCEASLNNLPVTKEPTILYSSASTKVFVQNTNNSALGGTILNIDSHGADDGSTTFTFPDVIGMNITNTVGIQMIYQKYNPFIWENSTLNVTAPILTVTLKDENGQKVETKHLNEPVKYVTPRTSSILDIGTINISYTRNNKSQEEYKSQMLHIKFSLKRGETKMFVVILPNNISNIWVYGPAVNPPDYNNSFSNRYLYPNHGKQMQASFGSSSHLELLESNSFDNKLYISADESLFGNLSSCDMYLGITLDSKDTVLVDLLDKLVTECSNDTDGNCNAVILLPLSMQLDSLFCVFWEETVHDWSTKGCKVHPIADSKQLECQCDHMSSFSSSSQASDFLVAPVMISFEDIMLFSTFFDNPVVVTVIILVWVIYLFAVHWVRRMDKKDIEQIGVLNCDDNSPSETFLYLVCVMTGWWKHAGTTANVYMSITGESGCSSKKRLSTNARLCFRNGFEDWFVFSTEKSLGALQTVAIWHDNSGTSPQWYLNQIYIKDLQSRMAWNFIYNDWLAVDRGDTRQTTATIQAITDEDMKSKQKYNFALISSRNLREGHLWVSIISKPPQSSFTRVQRLTCGLSLLLTMMLTNIMFYGLPQDNPEQQLEAGGFSFNLRQFIIGIESSIIMFPINFIILQLFIRLKPRPLNKRRITINNEGKKETGPTYEERLSYFYKKLFKLRTLHKDKLFEKVCLAFKEENLDDIGDLLIAKYLSTCSKNILRKSLSLGGKNVKIYHETGVADKEQLSQDKLNNKTVPEDEQLNNSHRDMTTSNCYERMKIRETNGSSDSSRTIYEKPLLKKKGVKKVLPWWFLYISWTIVIATCLTSSFFVMLYGLKYGYTRSVEWIVSFLTGFLQGVLVEQPLKVIGMAVVLALILHKQADIEEYGPDVELVEDEEYVSEVKTEHYKHQPFVEPMSDSFLTKIRDRLRLEWLMDVTIRDLILYALYLAVLLGIVYGHSNHHVSYLNSKTVYHALVEPNNGTSLQEVTSPDGLYSYIKKTLVPVTENLATIQRDETLTTANHYLIGFYRIRQVRAKSGDCPTTLSSKLVTRCVSEYTIGHEDTDSYTESWLHAIGGKGSGPWTYHDSSDLQTLPYYGVHATYSGGGYVQMLRHNATYDIADLEEKGWLDERTRAVFVECALYNPNVDIFTLVVLLFEMTPLGVTYPNYEIESTNLHHYTSDSQKIVAACEGLFVCFNILFIYIEFKKIRKLGKQEYFSDKWNIFELLQIALSFVVIGLFIKRTVTVSGTLNELSENKKPGRKSVNFYAAFFWNSVLEYVMALLVAVVISKAIKLSRFNARMELINVTISKVRTDLFGFFLLFMIISIAYSQFGYLVFGRVLKLYKNVHHSFYRNILIIIGAEVGLELQEVSVIFGPVFIITYVIGICYIVVQICVTILNAGRIVSKFELAGKKKL